MLDAGRKVRGTSTVVDSFLQDWQRKLVNLLILLSFPGCPMNYLGKQKFLWRLKMFMLPQPSVSVVSSYKKLFKTLR